jgi:hypothetical protein
MSVLRDLTPSGGPVLTANGFLARVRHRRAVRRGVDEYLDWLLADARPDTVTAPGSR